MSVPVPGKAGDKGKTPGRTVSKKEVQRNQNTSAFQRLSYIIIHFFNRLHFLKVCLFFFNWNDDQWSTHFSSFLAIFPLFCSSVRSRCSSSSSALRRGKVERSDMSERCWEEVEVTHARAHTRTRAHTHREAAAELHQSGALLEDGAANLEGLCTCRCARILLERRSCLSAAPELAGGSRSCCCCPSSAWSWGAELGALLWATYSFSWASRSLTSASRLLTSMTSSSSSSCSRLFWASVFCQSATRGISEWSYVSERANLQDDLRSCWIRTLWRTRFSRVVTEPHRDGRRSRRGRVCTRRVNTPGPPCMSVCEQGRCVDLCKHSERLCHVNLQPDDALRDTRRMTFPQENAALDRNFKHCLVYGNWGMFTEGKNSLWRAVLGPCDVIIVLIFDCLDLKEIYFWHKVFKICHCFQSIKNVTSCRIRCQKPPVDSSDFHLSGSLQ